MEVFEEDAAVFIEGEAKYYFGENSPICAYNVQVNCGDKSNCWKCGWNPKVAKRRAYAIRKKLMEEEGNDT